jgi:fatty-acyl-CoA synthase
MKGYYRNPEATAEAFKGGWFRSGDIAFRHPDGYIKIADRAKDIIISGGENVSSVEVEGALMHHPAVLLAPWWPNPTTNGARCPAPLSNSSPAQATEAELIAFAAPGWPGSRRPSR